MALELPEQRFAKHLERCAQKIRARLDLGPVDRLDPHALVKTYEGILLVGLHDLAGDRHAEDMAELKGASGEWSAIAMRVDTGPWLITWNPWHAAGRTRVSIMEEIAHIVLGHEPTAVEPHPSTGLPVRQFRRSKEQEAYGVAAASVLPFGGLRRLLRDGCDDAVIAEHFGVSEQLVGFRAQVTRAREGLQV